MTDLTPRDRARLAARHARDQLLSAIDSVAPTEAERKALHVRVDALWTACSLAMTIGDAPVFPSLMNQACRKERP